jgi:hypothetical protein
MQKPRVVRELAQPSLFEPAAHRPQWEDLPLKVRRRVTCLLAKLLSSRAAQSLVRAEGGNDE